VRGACGRGSGHVRRRHARSHLDALGLAGLPDAQNREMMRNNRANEASGMERTRGKRTASVIMTPCFEGPLNSYFPPSQLLGDEGVGGARSRFGMCCRPSGRMRAEKGWKWKWPDSRQPVQVQAAPQSRKPRDASIGSSLVGGPQAASPTAPIRGLRFRVSGTAQRSDGPGWLD
jgi:hypothetical protein